MSSSIGRKESERTKLVQEKCQTLLTQMLRDEDNKYCVDCDAKGPRWASWNLGVFLCIRCAGIHRNLGVHISRVKSVNLDTWTPEQVISLQQMGNSRARAVYEAQLPDGFRRPQTDTALESFIRAKYEHKKYLAREWVPPSPPKVDWAKEIDDELERQKRKKKAAQANSALGIGVMSATNDKKSSVSVKSSPLPAPLPKPKANQAGGGSPKTHRTSTSSTGGDSDLLGLSSPTKPVSTVAVHDLNNDSFSNFLSATTTTPISTSNGQVQTPLSNNASNPTQNSLAQEEQDFFKQGSLGMTGGDKDKSGKLTKDSILALYGTQSTHNPQMNFGGFTGMAPGGYMPPQQHQHQQQQQQQHHHHQFMTPPNSASMYNAPVMTAPNAFSTPAMNMNVAAGFGAQFPPSAVGYSGMAMPTVANTGIMSTGQQPPPPGNINLMQTNQNLLGGMTMFNQGVIPMNTAQPQLTGGNMLGMNVSTPMSTLPSMPTPSGAFQTSLNANSTAATSNLNQQFGNLNIGNVWQ